MIKPKGQFLLIDGKTEDDVHRSLVRVSRLTMRIMTSEPKVQLVYLLIVILYSDEFKGCYATIRIPKHVDMKNIKIIMYLYCSIGLLYCRIQIIIATIYIYI